MYELQELRKEKITNTGNVMNYAMLKKKYPNEIAEYLDFINRGFISDSDGWTFGLRTNQERINKLADVFGSDDISDYKPNEISLN